MSSKRLFAFSAAAEDFHSPARSDTTATILQSTLLKSVAKKM